VTGSLKPTVHARILRQVLNKRDAKGTSSSGKPDDSTLLWRSYTVAFWSVVFNVISND